MVGSGIMAERLSGGNTGVALLAASTSFANPAVTVARSLTDTFSGIRPADVVPFVAAQLAGAAAARLLFRRLRRDDATEQGGHVDHMGIQVESAEIVMRELARVKDAGLPVREEIGVDCLPLADQRLLRRRLTRPYASNRSTMTQSRQMPSSWAWRR